MTLSQILRIVVNRAYSGQGSKKRLVLDLALTLDRENIVTPAALEVILNQYALLKHADVARFSEARGKC